MAAISATKIAQHAGRPTLLATFGQPFVGNFAFRKLAMLNVKPAGGLEFVNRGDVVTQIQGLRTWHNGLFVELRDARTNAVFAHTRYFVKSDLCATRDQVEFAFPLFTYKPTAENDFGFKNTINFEVCHTIKPDHLGHCVRECPTGQGNSLFNVSVLNEADFESLCQSKYPKPWRQDIAPDACFYHTATPDQSCFDACSCLGGMPDVGAMIHLGRVIKGNL